jgi:hypothetical protein
LLRGGCVHISGELARQSGLLAGATGDISRLIGRPTTPLPYAITAALKR